MVQATIEVIDSERIGKKGTPRFPEAFGMAMPTKIVPADGNEHQIDQPTLSLQDYAAAKRWEKEVGGISIQGLQVASDDRSKMMIAGARVAAAADPNFTTQWKAQDGSFATIDAPAIIAISNAILAHVSNCFSIEAQVISGIQNETIKTVDQIDAAFA